MENHNRELTSISEKKNWAMPELIVIDKKVIEGGRYDYQIETSSYGPIS